MKHGAGVTLLPMLSSSRACVCVGARQKVCKCVSAYWGHVWVFIQALACPYVPVCICVCAVEGCDNMSDSNNWLS